MIIGSSKSTHKKNRVKKYISPEARRCIRVSVSVIDWWPKDLLVCTIYFVIVYDCFKFKFKFSRKKSRKKRIYAILTNHIIVNSRKRRSHDWMYFNLKGFKGFCYLYYAKMNRDIEIFLTYTLPVSNFICFGITRHG